MWTGFKYDFEIILHVSNFWKVEHVNLTFFEPPKDEKKQNGLFLRSKWSLQ